jgi:hypothetical protein
MGRRILSGALRTFVMPESLTSFLAGARWRIAEAFHESSQFRHSDKGADTDNNLCEFYLEDPDG